MSEKEIVYICRSEQNANLQQKLFNLYYDKLKWWVYRLLRGKFYSIPFSWYELDSIIYESFLKTIKTFDLKQTKYSFEQALFTITKCKLFSLTVKFISNKQTVLNKAFSYDSLEDFVKNSISQTSIDEYLEKENSELVLKAIKKYLNTQPPMVQKIIKYKLNDCTNREISRRLKIPVKKVSNTYNGFILKSRKQFGKNNSFSI